MSFSLVFKWRELNDMMGDNSVRTQYMLTCHHDLLSGLILINASNKTGDQKRKLVFSFFYGDQLGSYTSLNPVLTLTEL